MKAAVENQRKLKPRNVILLCSPLAPAEYSYSVDLQPPGPAWSMWLKPEAESLSLLDKATSERRNHFYSKQASRSWRFGWSFCLRTTNRTDTLEETGPPLYLLSVFYNILGAVSFFILSVVWDEARAFQTRNQGPFFMLNLRLCKGSVAVRLVPLKNKS